jgi:PAS domain S-box-containing protein
VAITEVRPVDRRQQAAPRATQTLADLAHGPEAFRLLVEAVTDYAIFLVGPDGHILTWNLGAERIKGYKASEIIGKHISVFYTADDRRNGRPERNLRAAAQRGHIEDQGWRVRKDGTRFWADVQLSTLKDDQGKLFGYAKVTRDMTEVRAAQERERELMIERQARVLAEEALRSRDRFLAIASHELKTPVASLQVAVESLLLNREHGTLDVPRTERGIERMDRAVKRLAMVLGELLDVSSLEAGATTFTYSNIDVSRIAAEVIERFGGVEAQDRIVAKLQPAVIRADAIRIEQVITNLVDNALKYSRAPAPVTVRVAAQPDGALIEVSDQGIGLGLDTASGLFEPFSRASNAADIPGMGLGLFITREIVERHGGQISGTAAPDRGTTFRVTLPKQPLRNGDGGS